MNVDADGVVVAPTDHTVPGADTSHPGGRHAAPEPAPAIGGASAGWAVPAAGIAPAAAIGPAAGTPGGPGQGVVDPLHTTHSDVSGS